MANEIYERFEKLRQLKNVSVYSISKATGISTATFTNWKKGKYTPKREKMQLIADYFNVSVDYLMTGKEYEYTVDIANELTEILYADKSLQECFKKILALPKDKQEYVISMVNMFEEKGK